MSFCASLQSAAVSDGGEYKSLLQAFKTIQICLRIETPYFLSAVLSPFFATGSMCPLSFVNHEELKSNELKLVSCYVILPFIVFVRALVIDMLFNMSGLTPFEETADSGLTSFSHISASCAEVC